MSWARGKPGMHSIISCIRFHPSADSGTVNSVCFICRFFHVCERAGRAYSYLWGAGTRACDSDCFATGAGIGGEALPLREGSDLQARVDASDSGVGVGTDACYLGFCYGLSGCYLGFQVGLGLLGGEAL